MIPKLSIIIPVYNVEKYLSECLDSVINQTLKEIEIICVDDCSPDNSLSILNEYAKKDSRIKIIQHEKNQGLGAARNTGVNAANGEYIWFIDSDDFITKESCQLLYETAKDNDVDILGFCAVNFVYENNNFKKLFTDNYYTDWPKNEVIKPSENHDIIKKHFPVSACCYISKKDFISRFSFRSGVYFEDTDFTPIAFYNAEKLYNICYAPYFRRINPESITQTDFSKKKLSDMISVLFELANYIRQNYVPRNTFLYYFYISYIEHVIYYINKYPDISSNEEKKSKVYELKAYEEKYNKRTFIRIKNIFIRFCVFFLNKLTK